MDVGEGVGVGMIVDVEVGIEVLVGSTVFCTTTIGVGVSTTDGDPVGFVAVTVAAKEALVQSSRMRTRQLMPNWAPFDARRNLRQRRWCGSRGCPGTGGGGRFSEESGGRCLRCSLLFVSALNARGTDADRARVGQDRRGSRCRGPLATS
jgi:hypothetical protein